MSKVKACKMDVVTKKSGHQVTGMAVSVCTTPAAPSPIPIPYPTFGMSAEGIILAPMRTKIQGSPILNVGGVVKKCHGNEPGTLKEVVSLTTGGAMFPFIGAPIVLVERGMIGITGSMGMMNTLHVGGGGGAGRGGGGGGGGGAGAGGPSAPGAVGAPNAPTAPNASASGGHGSGSGSSSGGSSSGGSGSSGGKGGKGKGKGNKPGSSSEP